MYVLFIGYMLWIAAIGLSGAKNDSRMDTVNARFGRIIACRQESWDDSRTTACCET